MGNQASTIAKDLQTSNDTRYYVKNDVYNRVESDGRFAKKENIPTLDNIYTKTNINDLLKAGYYDQTTSDGRFAVKAVEGDLKALQGTVASIQSNTALKSDLPTLDNVYTKDMADGRFAKVGDAYLKAESDGKFAKIGDAYLKAESDGKYASQSGLTTLKDSMYTKADVDTRFAKYYDQTTSDSRYAKAGDAYIKADSDTRYAVKTTEADLAALKAGTYSKTDSDTRYAVKTTETDLANLKLGSYSKADIDKFIADFRNSLGLPSESPFPDNVNIQWALDQMAKIDGVTNRFRDVKQIPNVTSVDTCSTLCAGVPNSRIAVHRASTNECFCKTGVTVSTADPGTTTFIPNKLSQRGTWQQASKLPERTTYDVNADGTLLPQNDFCLTADIATGKATWGECLSSPAQVIKYTPSSGLLQARNGKCIIMKPDQSGVVAGDCPTTPVDANSPARWTWDNAGKFQSAMNPVTTGGPKMCLGTADPTKIVTGTEVATTACTTAGNMSWVPQNDYVAFNGIADMTGIGYNTSQVANQRECRVKCSADRGCDAYMHNPDTKDCILGKLAQVATLTAGIKGHDNNMTYIAGKNIFGDSLTSTTTTAASAVDCGSQCLANGNCYTMSYDSSKTSNNCVQYGASSNRFGNIAFKPIGANQY